MKKKSIMLGIGAVVVLVAMMGYGYLNNIAYKKSNDKVKRLDSYYHILNKWMKNKQDSILISDKLKNLNINNVAIYGMGNLGELLYADLKKEGVNVCAFVDKNADILYEGIDGIDVVNIGMVNEYEIDAIIVTPVFAFNDIYTELSLTIDETIKIVSLDDVLV